MCGNMIPTIGYAHGEVYCIKCGLKESYNALKPLTTPTVCRHCGNRMTDDHSEKILNSLKFRLFHKDSFNILG